MKERLKKLLLSSDPIKERDLDDDWADGELEEIVDHLLANGVIVPPCKIGDKIYEVTGEPGERIDIDEHTVSEVGLNGVFTRGGWPCYRSHRRYFAYKDEGVWWFFSKEDAEAERKRRDDP